MIAASHELHLVRAVEDVGATRRAVRCMAENQYVSRAEANRAELVATEIASNLVHHAHDGGFVLLRPLTDNSGEQTCGIEVIGVDSGPGIDDLERAMRGPGVEDIERLLRMGKKREGLGVGLSSLTRLANEFDIHTQPRCGTVVLARVLYGELSRQRSAFQVEGVSVAIVPSGGNGDGWAVRETPYGIFLIVVDGLGHGQHANAASDAALQIFENHCGGDLVELFQHVHTALRATRGAAASACRIPPEGDTLQYIGAGNVQGRILSASRCHGLVPDNDTFGINLAAPRVQLREYAWPRGATLFLHSDGVRAHFDSSAYPSLLNHDPAVIAATVYRDQRRSHDDASVVVLKDLREASP